MIPNIYIFTIIYNYLHMYDIYIYTYNIFTYVYIYVYIYISIDLSIYVLSSCRTFSGSCTDGEAGAQWTLGVRLSLGSSG